MRKEKSLVAIIVLWMINICALGVIGFFIKDEIPKKIIDIISVVLCALLIGFLIFICAYADRKGNILDRKMEIFLTNRSIDEGIEFFEHLVDYFWIGTLILKVKYYLVYLYFLKGENIQAFELLQNTKWRALWKNTAFFFELMHIYNSDLESAKSLFNKMARLKEKEYGAQKMLIVSLLKSVDTGIFDDKLLDTASYPIILDIKKKYLKC